MTRYIADEAFNLRRASPALRLLISLYLLSLLVGLGLGVLTFLHLTGLTSAGTAAYYAGSEEAMQFRKTYLELLITSHDHLFSLGLALFLVSHLFHLTSAREAIKMALYLVTFLAFFGAFGTSWLVVYVTPGLSGLLPVSTLLLTATVLLMATRILWDLWRPSAREAGP